MTFTEFLNQPNCTTNKISVEDIPQEEFPFLTEFLSMDGDLYSFTYPSHGGYAKFRGEELVATQIRWIV